LNVSAIILAGGRATRLNGDDKGLCLYRGKPLIMHVLNSIAPQVSDIVISANRHIEAYEDLGYKVVSDGNNDFDGPLKGVAQALPFCKHNKVLVITCDMPFLPTNLLTLFDVSSPIKLQVISVNQRKQLCFIMDKRLKTSLFNYVQLGNNRVMQWLVLNDCQEIEYLGDDNAFNNLNNPEDFLN